MQRYIIVSRAWFESGDVMQLVHVSRGSHC